MKRLNDYPPYIISANIRKKLDAKNILIDEGQGNEGDLVLVHLYSKEDTGIKITDQKGITSTYYEPMNVVGVLGNRESSTHVVGKVPKGGIKITTNCVIDWIGGNSGIIGLVEESPSPNNSVGAEFSTKALCYGLLKREDNSIINIMDLSIRPKLKSLSIPIIAISATSAEAGKTVLSCKIIKALKQQGLNIAAIKATGSGGVLDSQEHRKAGATIVLDQVDSGLITTYTSTQKFKKYIVKSFLKAEEDGADIIICEMGGDIIWAKNPELLKLMWFSNNLISIFIICNDALSAIGVNTVFLKNHPNLKYKLVASPFRNIHGMKNRVKKMLGQPIIDPNNINELKKILSKNISKLN